MNKVDEGALDVIKTVMEGMDAILTSEGEVKVFPCVSGDDEMETAFNLEAMTLAYIETANDKDDLKEVKKLLKIFDRCSNSLKMHQLMLSA